MEKNMENEMETGTIIIIIIIIIICGWLSRLWSFSGTLNIRCRILIGIQKNTIIVTTTHVNICQLRDCEPGF